MRTTIAFGACAVSALSTALVATGAEQTHVFYSERQPHFFTVDEDLVAVRVTTLDRSLPEDPFAVMGARLVPRKQVSPEDGILGLPAWFGPSHAAPAILTDTIVVKFADKSAATGLGGLPEAPIAVEPLSYQSGLFRVRFRAPVVAIAAANQLYHTTGVIFAHPDFQFRISKRTPQMVEPFFGKQWHLQNTGQSGGTIGADTRAAAAWGMTRGASSVVVAVIDLGFEQAHPDLQDAWLINPGEIPGNRIDDDHNGFVDDVMGWNFAIDGNNLIYGQASSHGTAVAGVIGARANGIGVSGICPECRVLPLVIEGKPSKDAAAFYYARSMGAAVISNSWGYDIEAPRTDLMVTAINEVALSGRGGKGTTIVFAMNNRNRDDCSGPYPDLSSLASVVAVSSIDHNDHKVTDSAWGNCLKLLAPSSGSTANGIVTTDRVGTNGYNPQVANNLPDQDYTNSFFGTSAAAPQVAAGFGLLYSLRPDLTGAQATDLMVRAADKVDASAAQYDPRTGHSNKYGYGRINIEAALRAALDF